MPNFSAETYQAEQLEKLLRDHGAPHLWVRKRGALLTIYSGVEDDPWPHARLRSAPGSPPGCDRRYPPESGSTAAGAVRTPVASC